MMGIHQVSSVCSVHSSLLFFSIRLVIALAEQKGSSSSCGLQNISSPFYLKGDPAGYGLSSCQLICEDNKTILDIQSNRYHVTEISYERRTMNVVDFGLASGNCSLPTRPSPFVLYNFGLADYSLYPYSIDYDSNIWATFMNCTMHINHDAYRLIPCLNQHNTFVYAVVGEHARDLQYLKPSCRFLTTIPAASSPEIDSRTDVFQLLQKGFVLSWSETGKDYSPFQYCLQDFR